MALALRGDFDAARPRLCARHSGDADQVRRLLALVTIYDGASRAEAAEMGGVSNRVFTSYTNIVDHCCFAWNKLVEQPWTIMSRNYIADIPR